MRLFCIPYAGAGASTYGPWRRRFAQSASVTPVQLPGREEQYDLPFCTSVDEAARIVAKDIISKIDGPYAIFGHSMGAMLAFEATHRLLALGCNPPCALIISAFPAPDIYKPRLTVEALEKNGFQGLKTLLGETFSAMLGNSELFEYAARIMHADISLCENYRFASLPRLESPVYVFGARSDPLCEVAELEAWDRHCERRPNIKVFDGDHFYFKGNKSFEFELERILATCP